MYPSTLAIIASGVGVNFECLSVCPSIKQGKSIKYIIYTLNKDNTEIIVDKSSNSTNYDDFIADLPEAECRWAVYVFECETKRSKRNKDCFYSWPKNNA